MRLVSKESFENARSRDLIYLYCDHCNNVFGTPKNDLMNKGKRRGWDSNRYCSVECTVKHRARVINKCKTCGSPARKQFCSHKCSAIFNNPLKKTRKHDCLSCGILHTNAKFCGHECEIKYKQSKFISEWKLGIRSGMAPSGTVCDQVRRYIFSKFGVKCSRCGWCEVNPASGRIPVQIEHIDGDFRNCSEENLTVLCPNCHSLTPTYMTLNRGRGRDVNGVRRRGQSSKPSAYYNQQEELLQPAVDQT